MISFKDLKRQVGIDDVAFHLGYQLNRHAGVGKYIELVLPDAHGGKLDAIIISHPREKEMQRYFHRNGSSKGDVVDFISENLYRFNKVGRNQWEVIGIVMADFANMPVIDNREYSNSLGAISQNFNPRRYVGEPITSNADYALGILKERGLSQKTIDLFSSCISIVRDTQNKFGLPMIGFPYREPGNDKIVGYELRGDRGFKGKAAGTNSTTAMWVAGIPSALNNPDNVNRVYFCESAYDAMAFYQANRAKIDLSNSAFVSVGGALSNHQVSSVMDHFYLAKAVDCFDNDLAGRVYGMRMAGVVDDIRLGVVQVGDKLQIRVDDRQIEMDIGKANAVVLSKQLGLSGRTEMWKPPLNYKDWNDVVRGMPLEALQLKTKFQRDENLCRIRQEMRERNEQKRGFHR